MEHALENTCTDTCLCAKHILEEWAQRITDEVMWEAFVNCMLNFYHVSEIHSASLFISHAQYGFEYLRRLLCSRLCRTSGSSLYPSQYCFSFCCIWLLFDSGGEADRCSSLRSEVTGTVSSMFVPSQYCSFLRRRWSTSADERDEFIDDILVISQ